MFAWKNMAFPAPKSTTPALEKAKLWSATAVAATAIGATSACLALGAFKDGDRFSPVSMVLADAVDIATKALQDSQKKLADNPVAGKTHASLAIEQILGAARFDRDDAAYCIAAYKVLFRSGEPLEKLSAQITTLLQDMQTGNACTRYDDQNDKPQPLPQDVRNTLAQMALSAVAERPIIVVDQNNSSQRVSVLD